MKKLLILALLAGALFPTSAQALHECEPRELEHIPPEDWDDYVTDNCIPIVNGAAAVAFVGDVTLPTFPCSGSGCTANFASSLAAGAAVTTAAAVGVVTGLTAAVNYSETCAGGQAVAGSATGTATLTGTNVVGSALPASAPFAWERVGLVALVRIHDGVGAAVFVPQGGLPTCTGGSVTATVAGAAVVV